MIGELLLSWKCKFLSSFSIYRGVSLDILLYRLVRDFIVLYIMIQISKG